MFQEKSLVSLWGEGGEETRTNICRQEEMVVLLSTEENLKPLQLEIGTRKFRVPVR